MDEFHNPIILCPAHTLDDLTPDIGLMIFHSPHLVPSEYVVGIFNERIDALDYLQPVIGNERIADWLVLNGAIRFEQFIETHSPLGQ